MTCSHQPHFMYFSLHTLNNVITATDAIVAHFTFVALKYDTSSSARSFNPQICRLIWRGMACWPIFQRVVLLLMAGKRLHGCEKSDTKWDDSSYDTEDDLSIPTEVACHAADSRTSHWPSKQALGECEEISFRISRATTDWSLPFSDIGLRIASKLSKGNSYP